MKKLVTTLFAMALFASSALAANPVRISMVYGGGGGGATTDASYSQDFVEIFNSSGSPINISGWTIEYGSATGNWGSSAGNIFTFPANTTIQPCKYILVALGSASANPAVPPVPAPDFSNTTTNLSGSNGKVALFNAPNPNVPCGSEAVGTLVDKMAYGSSNCPEVTATAALTTLTAAVRNGGGTVDTDNNAANFTVGATPTPRNSASPANAGCLATPNASRTWGAIKTIYR